MVGVMPQRVKARRARAAKSHRFVVKELASDDCGSIPRIASCPGYPTVCSAISDLLFRPPLRWNQEDRNQA